MTGANVEEMVPWIAFAVLNALLSLLLARPRSRDLPSLLCAVLFASNALVAAAIALRGGGLDVPWTIVYVVEQPSFLALLVLPFVFPARALGARGTRALLALAGIVFAAALAAAMAAPRVDNPGTTLQNLLRNVPFVLGGLLGTILLIGSYLEPGPRGGARTQAGILLAAYTLKASKAATQVILPPFVENWDVTEAAFLWAIAWWTASLAVPIALLGSRLRMRGRARTHRSLAQDAGVLAFWAAGFLVAAPALSALEVMVVRPLLFAYGILHHRFLEVDLTSRSRRLAAVLFTALAATLLSGVRVLADLGVRADVAIAVSLAAALALGGTLTPPLLRAILAFEDRVPGAKVGGPATNPAFRVPLSRPPPGGEPVPGSLFLGRYRVEASLGQGGFGRAFLARDEQIGRRVVLKVARRGPGPREARRLLGEARTLAQLRHPNVVLAHDVEEVGDACVLVLEHVEGGSLADRLRRGPIPLAGALAIADDVLAGLEAAHAAGIVHRDVKPGNVLLTPEGRAKVADFGAALARGGSSGGAVGEPPPGEDAGRGWGAAGTLRYMSPEQVRGAGADERSDVYSVGVVLHEMLSGRSYLDLAGRPGHDARVAILEAPPWLPIPGIPESVNALLAETLSKDPAARPASASRMRARIAAIARDEARPRG